MAPYEKPLPQPDEDTKGFWEGCRQHQLVIQKCQECNALRHPPRRMCPRCHSRDLTWEKVSGRGTLYSFIVIHQPVLSSFHSDAPYNVVQVALEEQADVILTGNVVGCSNDELRVGMGLEVVFDDVTEDTTIPRWRPIQS